MYYEQPYRFSAKDFPKMARPSLNRTREALEAYDRTEPERQALWDAAETSEDVYAAEAKDKEALDRVREAFAKDTKSVNSRDRAFLVGLSDLRRLAARA